MDKADHDSQVHAIQAAAKESEAQASRFKKSLADLQKEFEDYKKQHAESTGARKDAESKRQKLVQTELEQLHTKELADLSKRHTRALDEASEKLKKKFNTETEKVAKLASQAKMKDEEIDVLKEVLEKKGRQYLDSVSQADQEHERLKKKIESLTKELEQAGLSATSAAKGKSKNLVSPTKTASDLQVRAEIDSLKKELAKKTSQVSKAEGELEKVKAQLETTKLANETKINLLKSKVKTLEGQLAKKTAPGATAKTTAKGRAAVAKKISTPLSTPRFEQRTRFDETSKPAATVGDSTFEAGAGATDKESSRFSLFSTTPFLSRAGTYASSILGAGKSPPTDIPAAEAEPESPTQAKSKLAGQTKKTVFQLSPVRKATKSSGAARKKSIAVSKTTGKIVSLFDDDDDDDDGNAGDSDVGSRLAKSMKQIGLGKGTSSGISFLDDETSMLGLSSASDLQPKPRKRKRKLNNNVKLDLYDENENEHDEDGEKDHPDRPGSMFKRPKAGGLGAAAAKPSLSLSGAEGAKAGSKAGSRTALGPPSSKDLGSAESAAGGPMLGRAISPLKSRNKGIRKIFKV